jgi:23S rRNA pseudouridine1911/1915/1917 synthase
MTERRLLTADRAGERLDVFLARSLPDLSRAHAQRLIGEGHVQVDARPAKASLRLDLGQPVEVALPAPAPLALEAEPIPLAVIYEDADLIVVDKPAGMAVHPAPGHERSTLVNALLHCPDLGGSGLVRPASSTAWIRTRAACWWWRRTTAQLALTRQMAERTTREEYLALVGAHRHRRHDRRADRPSSPTAG